MLNSHYSNTSINDKVKLAEGRTGDKISGRTTCKADSGARDKVESRTRGQAESRTEGKAEGWKRDKVEVGPRGKTESRTEQEVKLKAKVMKSAWISTTRTMMLQTHHEH